MFVYSIADQTTFEEVENFFKSYLTVNKNVKKPVILVGNKADLR